MNLIVAISKGEGIFAEARGLNASLFPGLRRSGAPPSLCNFSQPALGWCNHRVTHHTSCTHRHSHLFSPNLGRFEVGVVTDRSGVPDGAAGSVEARYGLYVWARCAPRSQPELALPGP